MNCPHGGATMREKFGEGCDDLDLVLHETKGKPRGTYDADALRSRAYARHSTPCLLSVWGLAVGRSKSPAAAWQERNVSGFGVL
jgi:hypothetical protein